MSESMVFPIGYHFMPTDQQLITCYLLRRAMGSPLPSPNPILDKAIYGEKANPWHVFSDSDWDVSAGGDEDDEDGDGDGNGKKITRVTYAFTKLSKVVNGKTRIARTAGCGTWDGQTGPKKIYDESGRLVGSMKMFRFLDGKKGGQVVGSGNDHWIMHEYSLAGVSLEFDLKFKDYVICRIKRISKYDHHHEIVPRDISLLSSNSCATEGDELIDLEGFEILDDLSLDDMALLLQVLD